jgi:hypothetical protein
MARRFEFTVQLTDSTRCSRRKSKASATRSS